MKLSKKTLAIYMGAADGLAAAVKTNIQKNSSKIDNKTILALNKFIEAANDLVDFAARVAEDDDTSENDPTLQ